jgi:hypothetical protein
LRLSAYAIMSKMWEVDPETRSKVRGERREGGELEETLLIRMVC